MRPQTPNGRSIEEKAYFVVVGAASTTLYLTLSLILSRFAGMAPPVASASAFFVSVSLSYFGQRTLSFKSSAAHAQSVPRFAVAAFVGFFLAGLLTKAGVHWLKLPDYAAYLLTAATMAALSFTVQKRWVFAAPAARER